MALAVFTPAAIIFIGALLASGALAPPAAPRTPLTWLHTTSIGAK